MKDTKIGKVIKGFAAVSTAFTGLSAVALAVGTRVFFSVAFERKPLINLMGSGEKKLEGEAKKGQDWLRAHDDCIVTMTNREGMKLRAHYIPAENAKCTVIEFHGWNGSWDVEFSASSPRLHERGYNLLLVEQRGQGKSEGNVMTFGLKERFDLMDWIHWYQKNMDGEIPIYLGGVSMGATTVLMASPEDFPPQVKGIFADCGFTSPYAILTTVGKQRFHMMEHPGMDLLNLYSKKVKGLDLMSWTALDAVKEAKLPILFVHGKEDRFVPWQMTQELYDACSSEKELLLVEGASHGMSFVVDMDTYLRKIEEFVERTIERC